jgi:hypothetical protein
MKSACLPKILWPTVLFMVFASGAGLGGPAVREIAALEGADEVEMSAGQGPDAFAFIDQIGMPLSNVIISNTVTVTGISSPASISIIGGEYSISTDGGNTWGGWMSMTGTVNLNNQVKVRLTSSSGFGTRTDATLTIGGAADTFSVTTAPAGDANAISGVVSWWKAENDASDSIGGNHGAPMNGVAYATGQVGQAFLLNGSDGSVQVPDSPAFHIGPGDFSLHLWADFASVRSGAVHTLPNVFVAQDEGSGETHKWVFYSADGGLYFHINNNGHGFVGPAAFTPQPGRWYHLVLTRSGSDYSFYVNGTRAGGVSDPMPIPDVGAPLTIGQAEGLGYFHGMIDEVKVYSRALSAAEVAKLSGMVPDAFGFTAQTGVLPSTVVESNVITISGLVYPTPISITGGEFAVSTDGGSAWGGWTSGTSTLSPNSRVKVRQTSSAGYSTSTTATLTIGGVSGSFSVTTGLQPIPIIHLNRTILNFGSQTGSQTTPSQSVMVSNSGTGTLFWTAMPSAAWITAAPGGGTGAGTIEIGLNLTGLAVGKYSGSVAFMDPNATNSPQNVAVNLEIYAAGGTKLPFGDFATPLDGTTGVTGAIPVTGWVLDDVQTTKVEIWRDPVLSAGEVNSLYFIGTAIFVEGARPDVEAAYPTYPLNSKAGWGYMLLTNFLPAQGNGTFKLYALATDKEGNVFTLGTRTIVCDNAHAAKPFGTIDTPSQGGDASGNPYLNFGWVLTPQPKTVPKNGSTIQVFVDSVLLGTLQTAPNVYNQYRPDVSGNFPGLNNTGAPGLGGPVGAYFLNTTAYANGVHTIYWIAYDDAGAGDGIGSRYFNVVNTGASPEPREAEANTLSAADLASVPRSYLPIRVNTGLDLKAEPRELLPGADGIYRIEIPEANRVEIDLGDDPKTASLKPGRSRSVGYGIVGNELRPLPIGSHLDTQTGRFSWMPGPGFVGTYDLVFVKKAGPAPDQSLRVKIDIRPKR